MPPDAPVLVLVERDMAKALGFALRGADGPACAGRGRHPGGPGRLRGFRPSPDGRHGHSRGCQDIAVWMIFHPCGEAGEEIVEKRGGGQAARRPKGGAWRASPPLGGEERRRSVRLSTTLFGQTFQFSSIKEVLAKANEEKSGDVLAGIAAASGLERIAAKEVLSNLLVSDLRENPVVPYEDDEVTRIIQDGVDPAVYQRIRGVGPSPSLREHILSYDTTEEDIKTLSRGAHRRGHRRRVQAHEQPGPDLRRQQRCGSPPPATPPSGSGGCLSTRLQPQPLHRRRGGDHRLPAGGAQLRLRRRPAGAQPGQRHRLPALGGPQAVRRGEKTASRSPPRSASWATSPPRSRR